MKTVIDAVNEYKGYLPFNTLYIYDEKAYSNMFFVASMPRDSRLICTDEEFNQCVQECEANFGNGNMHELSNYRDAVSLGNAPIAKPSQPLFTQAQADKNKLPPIGCECMVIGDIKLDDDYHKCKIISHEVICGDLPVAVFMITDYNEKPYYYSHCSANKFKPITPPIELIDGKAYQVTIDDITCAAIYYKRDDMLHTPENMFNLAVCTNIKLLEVKS